MSEISIRPVQELDVSSIEEIDEKITGTYQPDHWERQVRYYLTRDSDSALVALDGDQVVGFMFGDIRGWEFGFSTPTGWIEVVGIDPDCQGKGVAKKLADTLLAHWRKQKVGAARTLVSADQKDLAAFMGKLGMTPAEMTAFELPLS